MHQLIDPPTQESFGNERPKTIMHQLIDPRRSMPQLTEPPRASSKVNRGKEEGEKLKADWTSVAWRACWHEPADMTQQEGGRRQKKEGETGTENENE